MSTITRFKNVGGLAIKFFQRRNFKKIYKWLQANPKHVFESHHTPTWIENIDPLKKNRLAGQTRGELDLILNHQYQSPNPSEWTPFSEMKEMMLDTEISLELLRKEFPNQVRLSNIDEIIFLYWNVNEQKVKWRFRDVKSGWNDEEVDLKTTLIMDGLKTGNYPGDDFKTVFEIQEFFEDRRLYDYYQKMKFTPERKLPILCRGGGLGALQVGEEDVKTIFVDPIKFNSIKIFNNDRMSDMREKYLKMPADEREWPHKIFSVGLLHERMKLGEKTELIENLFNYIKVHYPDFPEELLHRLVVSFNENRTVKLLAVMVRSFGYKEKNALPGLVHPNYRNIQPFGDTTGFKTIAPTNLVGSFVEQVTNADLFLYDREFLDFTFVEASNTRHFIYRPQVQFKIRQMVKELITPEKEFLQWIDSDDFWKRLNIEINTNFRALTSVRKTTLERQMILYEVYKSCPPVAALLQDPEFEKQLEPLFMTFANQFQG